MEGAKLGNPLRNSQRVAAPCTIVIFGGTGDLARRKLIPSLYHLTREGLIGPDFAVVGIGRTEGGDEEYRGWMREALGKTAGLTVDDAFFKTFSAGLFYHAADAKNPADYDRLKALLDKIDGHRGTAGNRLFYLATAPGLYADLIGRLGAAGLNKPRDGSWVRIIIEKPFGRDLETARVLNRSVGSVFEESQVYRIDHYLGKDTVQNLLMFRFANAIFEPLWNRLYIDHVQITVSESLGVGSRAEFYEQAGVIRDMFQNHLLQLLCLTAMAPPVDFDADAVQDEKVKVLKAIRPFTEADIRRSAIRGQYSGGWVEGSQAPGYRKEPNVAENSNRETFAAIRFLIDNWRWRDVPFYIRSGKRLVKRTTEIAVAFKETPHPLFKPSAGSVARNNYLVFRIQPQEGISLRFEVKQPGHGIRLRPVTMDFDFSASFGKVGGGDAYERLLLDAILGDSTLFMRHDEVELAWSIVTPILEAWESNPPADFPNYEAGTAGPTAADALLERDGRQWRRL